MNSAHASAAPAVLLPPARPLMTGEVLDAAFRLFRASLLRSLPYSGLAVLTLQLPALYAMFFPEPVVLRMDRAYDIAPGVRAMPEMAVGITNRQIVLVIALLICTLLFGVITLRMHAIARGVRPRFRTEIATAFRRWPASIVATIVALGLPLLLATLWSVFRYQLPGVALLVAVLALLWPSALLITALPAFWCDQLGPFTALVRTVRLAVRRTWRVVGAMLATACILAVFLLVGVIILFMLGPLMGRADLFLISTITALLWLVFGAFGVPFVLAMLVVAYEDLKLRDSERRGASA